MEGLGRRRRRVDEAFGLPDGRVLAGHGGEEAEMPVETLLETRSLPTAVMPVANISPG